LSDSTINALINGGSHWIKNMTRASYQNAPN